MKEIPLTKGKVALVDDKDFESISKHKWCALETRWGFYAVRGWRKNGKLFFDSMHNVIMSPPNGFRVDHKNRNGLDNQRSNFRFATVQQNNANIGVSRHNTSGFKGVGWNKACKKWKSAIYFNNRTHHLGVFQDIKDAATAYDNAAKKFFGEFACTNKMLGLL